MHPSRIPPSLRLPPGIVIARALDRQLSAALLRESCQNFSYPQLGHQPFAFKMMPSLLWHVPDDRPAACVQDFCIPYKPEVSEYTQKGPGIWHDHDTWIEQKIEVHKVEPFSQQATNDVYNPIGIGHLCLSCVAHLPRAFKLRWKDK